MLQVAWKGVAGMQESSWEPTEQGHNSLLDSGMWGAKRAG